MTRFKVDVHYPSYFKSLIFDLDVAIVPSVGQSLHLCDEPSVTTEIFNVTITPTMDPVVTVIGRTLKFQTVEEGREIIETICRKEGWRIVG